MLKRNPFSMFVVVGSLAIASTAFAADELGRVSEMTGDVTAQQPGAEPRSLACGDPVFPGDTLRTGQGSHVGVQLGDVATHLDANSQVVLGRTAQNTPSARLMAGKVRMIDPREEGEPAQLAVLDADAKVQGNDAEGYIFSEKIGPYAMLCEWDDPLAVSRGSDSKTAKPGECVIAKPKEPLYTAKAHEARIPALAQECASPRNIASLNDPMHHLSPEDVAAVGPMLAAFQPPDPAQTPDYVCDTTDEGVCSPERQLVAVEPDPVIEDPCAFGFCPGNEPPANEPPANEPPANEPPANEPPANEPPANEPPANEPPANEPPANEPPVTAGGPPPFSDEFPGNSGTTPPPFDNEIPGNSGTTPPNTNDFPGNGQQTPPVNQPPVIEPPVTTAGGPPPFSNIFPGNSTPPAPFTDVPPAPPVADVPPFTNVFPAQSAPFADGFPAVAPNHNPGV